jgi:hypothetical protein
MGELEKLKVAYMCVEAKKKISTNMILEQINKYRTGL